MFGSRTLQWKVWWTLSLRGRRSRNKVSVGEPAEGSFARFRQHHVNCFVGVCVRMSHSFMQMPEGGGALMTSVSSSFLLPWCTCNAFKHNCTSTCNFIYNFQRWMSRFDQRWRAQRSAISIVNCRIPWTDRNLNAYCAFGISLTACLLQCVCFFCSSGCCSWGHAAAIACASRFAKFAILKHQMCKAWLR